MKNYIVYFMLLLILSSCSKSVKNDLDSVPIVKPEDTSFLQTAENRLEELQQIDKNSVFLATAKEIQDGLNKNSEGKSLTTQQKAQAIAAKIDAVVSEHDELRRVFKAIHDELATLQQKCEKYSAEKMKTMDDFALSKIWDGADKNFEKLLLKLLKIQGKSLLAKSWMKFTVEKKLVPAQKTLAALLAKISDTLVLGARKEVKDALSKLTLAECELCETRDQRLFETALKEAQDALSDFRSVKLALDSRLAHMQEDVQKANEACSNLIGKEVIFEVPKPKTSLASLQTEIVRYDACLSNRGKLSKTLK